MVGKSILEQALLQVETLEEAVKANAKGILASTMKQELNGLLKEQEDEKNPEEDEKDVEGATTPEDGNDTSISDENPEKEETPGDSEEIPDLHDELGGDKEPDSDSDDVLDMTGASEEEVLKVFKAMKPEDGIVVKKDGDTVQFSDEGNDYIIKLDDDEEKETPELPSAEEGGEELPAEGGEEDEFGGLSEQEQPAGEETDEVVYEIELDEEDEDQPFTEKGKNQVTKKSEPKESVALPTKSPNKSDPFEKDGKSQGAKLRSTEVKEETIGGAKRPGTPVKGTGSPETKEPGKGGEKEKQVEKHDGTPVKGTKPAEKKEPGKGGSNAKQVEDHPGTPIKGEGKPVVKEFSEEEKECAECGGKIEADEAARTKSNPHGDKFSDRTGIKSKKMFKAGSQPISGAKSVNEEVEILRKQNGEYKKALVLFKDKLNEVAIFNANLAYATRLFTEHSTTKQEKLDILKRFDAISTITESKNLYTSIKGELETKKPISESMVEKIAATPTSSATEVLSEAKAYENPQFRRMKELMTKIK
jgi:hypothetical protein